MKIDFTLLASLEKIAGIPVGPWSRFGEMMFGKNFLSRWWFNYLQHSLRHLKWQQFIVSLNCYYIFREDCLLSGVNYKFLSNIWENENFPPLFSVLCSVLCSILWFFTTHGMGVNFITIIVSLWVCFWSLTNEAHTIVSFSQVWTETPMIESDSQLDCSRKTAPVSTRIKEHSRWRVTYKL